MSKKNFAAEKYILMHLAIFAFAFWFGMVTSAYLKGAP